MLYEVFKELIKNISLKNSKSGKIHNLKDKLSK